jgi:hypothetical protein
MKQAWKDLSLPGRELKRGKISHGINNNNNNNAIKVKISL